MSTLAGEVAHPRKTFPRALFIGVGLVVFMYLGPLLVGLGVTTDADSWELGYFTEVAKLVRRHLSLLPPYAYDLRGCAITVVRLTRSFLLTSLRLCCRLVVRGSAGGWFQQQLSARSANSR